MLEIKDLHVSLEEEDKQILKGVNLTVEAGKVHAIMGPNGSGKSTLSYVLSGKDGYEVTGGSAALDSVDLLEMDPEERIKLEDLYEGSLNLIRESEVVEGTVVSIGKKEIVVNIGYKSEGQIPIGEFTNAKGEVLLKAGDAVEVLLESRLEPELLAGVRVLVANKMIDSSARGRLDGLRQGLLGVRLKDG